MVQRRATRFATSTYSREPGTVTNILNTLGEKLADWLSSIKLPLTFHLTSEDPPYLHGNTTLTKLSQISTSTDAYKFSFLLRTRSLPGYHARELQGHPETADVNSERSSRDSRRKQWTIWFFPHFTCTCKYRAPRLTFAQQYLHYGITIADQPYRCRTVETRHNSEPAQAKFLTSYVVVFFMCSMSYGERWLSFVLNAA